MTCEKWQRSCGECGNDEKDIVPVACSNLLVKRFTATTEHVKTETQFAYDFRGKKCRERAST